MLLLLLNISGLCLIFWVCVEYFVVLSNISKSSYSLSGLCIVFWGFVLSVGALYSLRGALYNLFRALCNLLGLPLPEVWVAFRYTFLWEACCIGLPIDTRWHIFHVFVQPLTMAHPWSLGEPCGFLIPDSNYYVRFTSVLVKWRQRDFGIRISKSNTAKLENEPCLLEIGMLHVIM